ncbi:hypothetical protein [Hymenobacter jeollabukensis]|uniref:Uncharacterized protein n=1 Tax=Hymenobacter jeollabukensis TaxID=2025313 RepID=A0A5R8WIV1_9BACT|nr:hypothetical protein [Hymenobacter jeollabukensis]TLM88705.1 hypothetical protein FDY95_22995 [Hymenobacter jeollabukensis]
MKIETGLSTEQIDQLQAGPDTDELIGRHLLQRKTFRPRTAPLVPGYLSSGRNPRWQPLPRYSVDPVAMLELLELLRSKGVDVRIDSTVRLVGLTFRDRGRGGVDGVAAEWSGELADLPLSLSKAALKLPQL